MTTAVARVPGAMSLIVLAAMAAATPCAEASMGYGVRLGANLATIRGDFAEIADPDLNVGSEVGLHLDHALSPYLALQVEADYVSKGAVFESEETDQSGNPIGTLRSELQLQYIEVPMLVRATFLPWGEGSPRPYLLGGPTVSFALDGKFAHDFDLPDQDVGDDMKKTIWGVTGGVGLRFPTQLVGVAVEGRYRTDFGDLWDLGGNLESINQGISLTMVFSR